MTNVLIKEMKTMIFYDVFTKPTFPILFKWHFLYLLIITIFTHCCITKLS